MSRRVLRSTYRDQWRDWLLFAVAALVPALAVGWLGLRALQGHEDATRRELSLGIEAAAERTAREAQDILNLASTRLHRVPLPTDLPSLIRELQAIAPVFAQPVVVSPDGDVVFPQQRTPTIRTHRSVPSSCTALADELSRSPEQDILRRDEFLRDCKQAQGVTGRWLWPLIALQSLTPERIDALGLWFEQHASAMRSSERAATLLALNAVPSIPARDRQRMVAALSASGREDEAISDVLRQSFVMMIVGRSAEENRVEWRSDSSAGWLRTLPNGNLAGFVVHASSVGHGLENQWPRLSPDHRASLVIGSATSVSEAFSSVAWVMPSVGVRVTLADPLAVEKQSSRSRIVLICVGIGAIVVAFALAAGLFLRMRAAKELSALRAGFVSTVSHELRTPIASLRMLSELLEQNRVESDELDEVYGALAREAKRLGETVDRLLGFSRMSAGRYVIDRKDTLLVDVVSASVEVFHERHRDVPRVHVDVEEGLSASLDEGQVRLALDNLLENAAKYAPQGTPYEVCGRLVDGWVVIEVRDHGPGIGRREKRRIFKPFERGDDRLSSGVSGSGIGLSLVRQVAEAHGGKVEVLSERGEGAMFRIGFPRSGS